MPAFVPLIAAAVGAAATIYATESSRGKGAKAPAPGMGGGAKGPVKLPDVFGSDERPGGLLGGGSPGLAQALEGGSPQRPSFGPAGNAGFLGDEQKLAWLKNLMSGGGR